MAEEKRGRLVLSRACGETINIGGDIQITVVEIRRGEAVLSIRAPRSVRVLRSELENTPPREKQ